MRIVVNTSAYAQASAELSSARVFVRQALDGLSSGLAGAHQMAGNDDAGTTFAHDYDEAARKVPQSFFDKIINRRRTTGHHSPSFLRDMGGY